MIGRVFVFLLLLVAVLLAVPAVSHTNLDTWLSLTASSVAFVAMGLNQFLATRPKILEGLFGGLDRVYHLHRHMGIIALVCILIHYFVEPNFKGKVLTTGLDDLAADVGEIAFYILIALLALSLVKRIPRTNIEIPYHLWRISHRFMGIVFLMVAFHQFFIKRPFDGTALLANYLNIIAIIGILSFLHTQLIMRFRKRTYEVTDVEKTAVATIIQAKPTGGSVRSSPGQFAFLNARRSGLTEPHPFTLAGRGDGGEVRFAIKPLGDFTTDIRGALEVGDQIQVEGGYGRFSPNLKIKRQLWLAGGIGITPFLAMAEALTPDDDRKICLVHAVATSDDIIDSEALRAVTNSTDNFHYVPYISSEEGRLDAEKLAKRVPFELDGAGMWFCGPPPLRKAIEAGAKKLGKKFSLVKYELFEFR